MKELAVQSYLRKGGSPASLKEWLHIKFYEHPSLPLVGFKYSQVDSPKMHPIVRECRGLVLEKGTWNLVAKPFERFFSPEQDPEGYAKFRWPCHGEVKHDGSLAILYYYDGVWRWNTSGSFALGQVVPGGPTWQDHFWATTDLAPDFPPLDDYRHMTLVFEVCARLNKVVRDYPTPQAFLIGAFDVEVGCGNDPELAMPPPICLDEMAAKLKVQRPARRHFMDRQEVESDLRAHEKTDPSFEGYVLRDSTGHLIKAKTDTWNALSHAKERGADHPRTLIPLIMSGGHEEAYDAHLKFFPEAWPAYHAADNRVLSEWGTLAQAWLENRGVVGQKEFALRVKDHPWAAHLFRARKEHGEGLGDLEGLWETFSEDSEKMANRLYPHGYILDRRSVYSTPGLEGVE